jgi:hypothetical protein
MFHQKCPKCIAYIQDTLNHPLRPDHPLQKQIVIAKLQPLLSELAEGMETFIKSYVGHKNLAPRLLRDAQNIKQKIEPEDYYRIYTLILRWYQDLYFSVKIESKKEKEKRKHPFQKDMETLAILAIEVGGVRTDKRESPIIVFTKWFMEHYLFLLNHLDALHDEHEKKIVKSSITESKWDRSDLNLLYD